MEFRSPSTSTSKTQKIECKMIGADDATYGIVKEGCLYYIKRAKDGADTNLLESYDYLNGASSGKENAYNSYNEASKHLELKLMSLNEAYGRKLKTSTVDVDKPRKDAVQLTESARAELNRVHQIFENSFRVNGKEYDKESKGHASAEDTTGNNKPFSEKAEATLDKDMKENGTMDKANKDYAKVTVTDKEMESDKMKTGTDTVEKDSEKAKCDLSGTCVATEKKTNGKAVKMNEEADLVGFSDEESVSDTGNAETTFDDTMSDDFEDTDSLDSLLREFDEAVAKATGSDTFTFTSEEDVLKGPKGVGEKNSVKGEKTMERMNENDECGKAKCPSEEALKGPHGKLGVQSWDKMDDKAIDEMAERICESYMRKSGAKKETIQETVDRMVKEEFARLNVWGKHPRYQKQPMTTPANKEVAKPDAAHEIDDKSVASDKPFGTEIGKSDPFTEKVDQMVATVYDKLMESLKQSKKA